MQETTTKTPELKPNPDLGISQELNLATGLLRQDLNWVGLWALALALPGLFGLSFNLEKAGHILSLGLLERILQLTFLYLLCRRWLERLGTRPLGTGRRSLLQLFGIGFGLWSLFILPILLQFVSGPESIKFLGTLLLIPAIVLSLQYFFYALPVMLGPPEFTEAMRLARLYTINDRLLALKVLIGPASLMGFLVVMVYIPSPDGLLAWQNYLAEILSGSFWILCYYSALALCLHRLPEQVWQNYALDPYRQARLSTLSLQGWPVLAKILSPKTALILLAMTALTWMGNYLRAVQSPPPAKIRLESISIVEDKVRLTLRAEDTEFRFKNFHPIYFTLAGETRSIIAVKPDSATLRDDGSDALYGIKSESDVIFMELIFSPNRTGRALTELKDLYLWYRQARLIKIDFPPESSAPKTN